MFCRHADIFRPAAHRAALALALTAATFFAAAQAATARVPYRGVVVHSLWAAYSDRDMVRDLDAARRAGSNTVRTDVAWASLEVRGKGQISQWYLRRMDRLVARSRARGMKVIMTLWASPCWASSAPASIKGGCKSEWNQESVIYPPSNPADYGDIARFITARYGTQLAALEVWNEPNLGIDMFFRAADKPAAYARILRAAYGPAKAGNPGVPVLAGALVRPDVNFLRALYANGIKGYYDGFSIHPYGVELSAARLNNFHNTQQANGDPTWMWVTEFGAPTSLGGGWHVTEKGQARQIKRDFRTLDRLRYVEGSTLYALRDSGRNRFDFIQNFGVLRANFSAKLGYKALRSALRRR
ncbi:MAG: polysaccharide biosynthesis protein PslG [Solirubrobacteraceae bacterium]|nr:polysaccharide biosynthesis protein PslG [Solirubrobacteraceae bacterium]